MKGTWAPRITTVVLLLSVLLAQRPAEGKKYALLVGVNQYQHERLPRLHYAVNDTRELADLLRNSGYQVTVLSDEASEERLQPTRSNIERELKAVLDQTRRGDLLLLGFAGHGLQFEDSKDAFFCPCDARPFQDRTDSLLSLTGIYQQLERSFAGMKVLLVDACRNDPNVRGVRGGVNADSSPRPPQGVAALFSCRAGEVAREHDELKHGVFFHHVLQGLKGEARDRKGQVTFAGLAAYVNQEVPLWVEKKIGEGARQSPNLKADYSTEPVLLHLEHQRSSPEQEKPEPPRQMENSIGIKLVLIPAGEFLMGSPESEQDHEEKEGPQHKVKISRPFYMGAFEVTIGQFQVFLKETSYQTRAEWNGRGGLWYYNASTRILEDKLRPGSSWRNVGWEQTTAHPVVNVSWNDAVAFCRWLSQKESKTYRLPTEAEWEYACRAGTSTRFSSGDRDEDVAAVGNVADASQRPWLIEAWVFNNSWNDGYPFTAPVGRFKPNRWGLYDMHGNVWEWCSDCYAEDYYRQSPEQDPAGPLHGVGHVVRGGGFFNPARYCRSAYRALGVTEELANEGAACVGFRLVLVPEAKKP